MYMSVLILNREQVKQVISMKEVIQEVREVYRLKSQGKSVIWPSTPPWTSVPAISRAYSSTA